MPVSVDGLCVEPPDVHGNLQPRWSLALGNGEPARATVGPHGDIFVGGSFIGSLRVDGRTFTDPDPDHFAGFLLRLNSDGHMIWERTMPPEFGMVSDLGADPEGNVYVATDGGRPFIAGASGGLVLAKLDADGHDLWKKIFPITGTATSFGQLLTRTQLAVDPMGNVAITGGATGSIDFGSGLPANPDRTLFVASFDPSGTNRWSHSFDQQFVPQSSLAFDPAGNLVVVGGFNGVMDLGGGKRIETTVQTSGFAAKLDTNGKAQWIRGVGDGALVSAVAAGADRTLLAGLFMERSPWTAPARGPRARPTCSWEAFQKPRARRRH